MHDYWVYWLAGLWDADIGSTAKGLVSIKNKSWELLAGFIIISIEKLGINPSKFRVRVTKGYSTAYDVYYTSTRVRRLIEEIIMSKDIDPDRGRSI